jgi:hypothetical protein
MRPTDKHQVNIRTDAPEPADEELLAAGGKPGGKPPTEEIEAAEVWEVMSTDEVLTRVNLVLRETEPGMETEVKVKTIEWPLPHEPEEPA